MLMFLYEYLKNLILSFSAGVDPGASRASQQAIAQTQRAEQKLEPSPETPKKFGFAVNNYVTSPFGPRTHPVTGVTTDFHAGVDFSCWGQWGAVVRAPESGRVTLNGRFGTTKIGIVAIKGDHTGCYHYLCHTGDKNNGPSPLVKVGDHVEVGQAIAYVNNTGQTTGPHVHHTLWSPTWACVDVGLWYKKYAPDLFAQMQNYTDRRSIHRTNKTGTPEADI